MPDDLTTRTRVRAALDAALGPRAATVAVVVDRGVAALGGFVGDYRDRLAATDLAAAQPGVLAVADGVEVRDAAFHERDDADVARACAAALAADARVPAGRVRVTVGRGHVRLTGELDPAQAAAARETVVAVGGVCGVTDCSRQPAT